MRKRMNSLGPGWTFALSHYQIKRLVLEQRSLGEVLRLMREFPVCSNGNYMLADGSGAILDVELISEGPFVPVGQSRFLVHSNHFLCPEIACDANWQLSLPDSLPRLDRLRTLIDEMFPSIRLEDVQQFLADHDGEGPGLSDIVGAMFTRQMPTALTASPLRDPPPVARSLKREQAAW